MDLTDKSELIKYLKQNGLWAKKSLGQNFLVDKKILDKIIESAELKSSDTVLEIGPGLGTLTQELIKRAGKVVAIEKDDRIAELLKSQIANHKSQINNKSEKSKLNSKLQIIRGDVLDLEANKLMPNSYKLVANIPYYITSKVLEKFLTAENKPELIVLLVQREVAERICAKPGDMSVMSIAVQFYGQPEIVEIIKPSSFFPEPKVESAILKIGIDKEGIRRDKGKGKINEEELFKVVRAGFHARRKTLINNLMVGTNLSRQDLFDILEKIGLNKNVRAQELSIGQWQTLTKLLRMYE